MNRRHFMKVLVGALAFVRFAGAEEQRRGGAKADATLPFVKPGEGMAASLKYVENAKDWKDASLKVERMGVKWGQQKCENCALYVKKDDKSGTCALFANQLVKSAGICASWSKKA